MKYTVAFHTIEIKDGQKPVTTNQNFEFTNENPIIARREAIAKAKELEQECINDGTFDSGDIADATKYRNTKGYSIDIWLSDIDSKSLEEIGYEEGYEFHILGEEDEYEAITILDEEAKLYHNSEIDVKFYSFDYENDIAKMKPCIIGEDFDYLLNINNN